MRTKPALFALIAALGLAIAAAWWLLERPGKAQATGLFHYEDAAAVARGKALYGAHCAACHGAALEGEPNWRQRDAEGYLPAPPHDVSGHTWHHPDSQLFAITKHGTAALVGGDYKSRMIGFGETLSDTEILETLAYIKSQWPPQVITRHNQINAAN